MQPKLEEHLRRLLATANEPPGRPGRLFEDAQRLRQRIRRFMGLNLIPPESDIEAMELACFALQLPARYGRPTTARSTPQAGLRERCEQAAELLVEAAAPIIDSAFIDRAARILHELPKKEPTLAESRLLSDAVNLDDFGVTGLIVHAMQLARQGSSVRQSAEGFEKRRAYGYWDIRLRDGFFFEPIRQIARERLKNAQAAVNLLAAEIREDDAA